MKPNTQTGKIQKITIKGNPSAEEQALILARLNMAPNLQNAGNAPAVHPSTQRSTPWIRSARSESLSRWPQGTEDRYWQT